MGNGITLPNTGGFGQPMYVTPTPSKLPSIPPPPKFQDWSSCSKTCGAGTQTRKCIDNMDNVVKNSRCKGEWLRRCNTQPCKIPCVVSAWSEWTSCAPCNLKKGTTSRYRNIIAEPQHGGTSCPYLEETEDCEVSDDCYKDKYGLSVEKKHKITEHIQNIKNLI